MAQIVTVPLPHDLPENWNENQFVSPGGTEVGLTKQHGFNYLMEQVNNAQRAVQELDAHIAKTLVSGQNLLHNWYLRSPIDTKAGYVIPVGTEYYSDQALKTKVGTMSCPAPVTEIYADSVKCKAHEFYTQYAHKNTIVPGYVGLVAGSVCLDRWFLKSKGTGNYSLSSEVSYLLKGANGISLVLSKISGALYQNIANVTSADKFGGRTYTFSVKVESMSGGTPQLYIDDGFSAVQVPITQTGITTVTATLRNNPTAFTVGIKNTHETAVSNMQVSALKLEVGTASTLSYDAPADRAEQMAECIQFDPTTDVYRGFTVLTTTNIFANASITE